MATASARRCGAEYLPAATTPPIVKSVSIPSLGPTVPLYTALRSMGRVANLHSNSFPNSSTAPRRMRTPAAPSYPLGVPPTRSFAWPVVRMEDDAESNGAATRVQAAVRGRSARRCTAEPTAVAGLTGRDETPSGGTARRAMDGYALREDELHRLQRAGAATGGGASASASVGGRPEHEPQLTLASLSDQLHALARSHEASLGRLDGLAEAQDVLLREVRSATAGVHELQAQQRSLAERLELPTGMAVAAAGSDAEASVAGPAVVAAGQEVAAASSEQLREQTAELWMLQQALRAELQRRPDAETVDALLSRKLDRAGGEVAAHAWRTHGACMAHAWRMHGTCMHGIPTQARLRALEESRGAMEERLAAVEAAAESMHRELHGRRRSVRGSNSCTTTTTITSSSSTSTSTTSRSHSSIHPEVLHTPLGSSAGLRVFGSNRWAMRQSLGRTPPDTAPALTLSWP